MLVLALLWGCDGGTIAVVGEPAATDAAAPTPTSPGTPDPTTPAPEPSADCTQPFEACGGELPGTWRYASVCSGGAAETEITPSEASWLCSGDVLAHVVGPAGTLVFARDTSYTLDTWTEDAGEYTAPPGCLETLQLPDCGALAKAVGVAEGSDWTCADDGAGGCACTTGGVVPDSQAHDEGAWTATGTQVTLSSLRGEHTTYDYCASGEVAALVEAEGSAALGLVRP